MEKTSNAKTLSQRLRKKTAENQKQTEELTELQLKKLSTSLTNIVKRELRSILTDIRSETDQIKEETETEIESVYRTAQGLAWITKKQWIGTFLMGLCLLIGISAGSWGLMRYQTGQIQANLVKIQEQTQTLSQMKTQGITLDQNPQGTFIVLPQGMTITPGYKIGQKEALLLKRR